MPGDDKVYCDRQLCIDQEYAMDGDGGCDKCPAGKGYMENDMERDALISELIETFLISMEYATHLAAFILSRERTIREKDHRIEVENTALHIQCADLGRRMGEIAKLLKEKKYRTYVMDVVLKIGGKTHTSLCCLFRQRHRTQGGVMTKPTIELKACPCCGGKARFWQDSRMAVVHCETCNLGNIRIQSFDDAEMEVKKAWNRRSQ